MNDISKSQKYYLYYFLLALFAHGGMLLNDNLIWDSKFYINWLIEGKFEEFKAFFNQVGVPGWLWMHWPFHFFPNPALAHKVVGFLCIWLTMILTYKIIINSELFSDHEAVIVGAFNGIFPSCSLWGQATIFQYYFSFLIFLIATFWWQSFGRRFKITITARVSILVLYFISFNTASLLVLYYAVLLLAFFLYIYIYILKDRLIHSL